jgi:hypothetical protein
VNMTGYSSVCKSALIRVLLKASMSFELDRGSHGKKRPARISASLGRLLSKHRYAALLFAQS